MFVTAYEGAPDMEKHPALACVGMLKDLLFHVSIRCRRLIALRAEKNMRVVFQPDIDPGIVFRMFNFRDLPRLRKLQLLLLRFSCRHDAKLP